jgi:cytochrome P450/NADPH-cytochrome P450 reductase
MTTPIPQPPETLFIGNLREVDPDFFPTSLHRLYKLYGDIYRLNFLGKKIVVVCNQETNRLCLQRVQIRKTLWSRFGRDESFAR